MRNGSAHLLALIVLLATHAASAAAAPFSRMDVFALEWASQPRMSPDGRNIVYMRNGMDVMTDKRTSRLWLIRADGSGHVQLTARAHNERDPQWSPDGTRIVFIGDTDHGAEVFIHWLDAGRTKQLTQLEQSPRGLSWSPDGTRLAFSMLVAEKPPVLVKPPAKPGGAEWAPEPRVTTRVRYERDGSGYIKPGFNHLFVMPADGGTPRQVTRGDYHHGERAAWTPDGRALVFSANRNADWETDYVTSDIFSVDVSNGDIVRLTGTRGPAAEPAVSPDGQRIAWTGFIDKVQTWQVATLKVMNADGSNVRTLTADLDRSVRSPQWDRTGRGLYFLYDDRGDTHVGHVSLDGNVRVVASSVGGTTIGRPYGGGSFSLSAADEIVYTHVTAERPADLAVTAPRGRSLRVVTALNADVLDHRSLGTTETLWYTSSVDKRDIQGWIVKPPGFDSARRYPLIVENHGGPISNYGARFSSEIQLYAAAGYVVFYPNPRGSTGYGEAFGNLLYHNYPGDDYQDVMDGVDAVLARGYVDPQALFVTGGSAGGIMTAWIIGKNHRFRAAAVVKPVMNWFSKTLTADNYFQYANYRYPGQPWENIDTYMKFSPISLVGNVRTPTLVMVGTADLRTPLSEAKQLYHALSLRGIDTALVEMPGAAHLIAKRPSQLIAKVDHVLAWFEKYRIAVPGAGQPGPQAVSEP